MWDFYSQPPWYKYLDSITSVIIHKDVTKIGYNAFKGCNNIKKITIPKCVLTKNIRNVFPDSYKKITDITLDKNTKTIEDYAFYGCINLTNIKIPDGVTSIGKDAFFNCNQLKDITIPNHVLKIENEAFRYCSNLTFINLPNTLTSIGNNAFADCNNLTELFIPGSITTLGNGAFRNCSNLQNVTISKGVEAIGDNAFYNCTQLKSLTLPKSITTIGASSFSFANKLTDIYYSGNRIQWALIAGVETSGLYNNATIHYIDQFYKISCLIQSINTENELKITAAVTNNTSTQKNAIAFVAVYSSQDILKGAAFTPVSIPAQNIPTLTFSIKNYTYEKDDMIKLFLWDNLNSIAPLSSPEELKVVNSKQWAPLLFVPTPSSFYVSNF